MLKFYFNGSPNPSKVALFLEEAGLPYEPVPVDTRTGAQFDPAFLAINPNGKVPVIDDDGVIVFDSNAILLYLAEKTGQFLPSETKSSRAELLSWLMFVATGVGPFSGQAVHFKHFAPEPKAYALNRYDFEAWRHWNIVNDRLGKSRYMLGDIYTIVDMAVWGWARAIPFVLGDQAFDKLPHVQRLFDEINARFGEEMSDEDMEKLLSRQGEVQEKLDHQNAWDLDARGRVRRDRVRLHDAQ